MNKHLRIFVVSSSTYGQKVAHSEGVFCFAQLKQLKKYNSIGFLCFSDLKRYEDKVRQFDALKEYYDWIKIVSLKISKIDVIKTNIFYFFLKFLRIVCFHKPSALSSSLAGYDLNIIWILFPQIVQFITVYTSVQTVMNVQDAYIISSFRRAKLKKSLQKYKECINWIYWTHYEAKFYEQFLCALTLSKQDATLLSGLSHAVRSSNMGLPIDFPKGCPIPYKVRVAGSFAHSPNVGGLVWFLDFIWPQIVYVILESRLIVADSHPPRAFVTNSDASVEFVGFMRDIAEFYDSNPVTVVLLISGGGVKIKTVEAMLAGASTVVSTQLGVVGVGSQTRLNALVATEADSFADAVMSVLDDSLAAAVRNHVIANFSGEAWAVRVNTILMRLFGE
ncbi:MAG: glycosyltransferase family 4 protein [Azoarcus sp.]|nr:glycosyltransferase family 4 protein [Azoarcus sp.]